MERRDFLRPLAWRREAKSVAGMQALEELTRAQDRDALMVTQDKEIIVTGDDRFGLSGERGSEDPVVIRVATDRRVKFARLNPGCEAVVESEQWQAVGVETKLLLQRFHELIPKRAGKDRRMIRKMDLDNLATEPFREDSGYQDVRIKDDPHEISRNTSSSVYTPRARARGTLTRRDSAAASCQSLRKMARRTYSLVVRPLSLAARSRSRFVLAGRLIVRVSLIPVRLDHTVHDVKR